MGDKQFVQILLQVLKYGLEKVDAACIHALKHGISNADIIKQYLDGTISDKQNENLCCYNEALLQEANHDIR